MFTLEFKKPCFLYLFSRYILVVVTRFSVTLVPFSNLLSLIMPSNLPFLTPVIFTSLSSGKSDNLISNQAASPSVFIKKMPISLNKLDFHSFLMALLISSPGILMISPLVSSE